MYRAEVTMNKTLQKRWNEHLNHMHMERLSKIRPRIDMKNPACFGHLFKKCKKEQLIEGTVLKKAVERFTEIERANRFLLERLTRIMKGSHSVLRQTHTGFAGCRSKSLNRGTRKKEISRIMDENQALLKRLQAKRSNYNVTQWNKDYKSRAKMLSNICEFPYRLSGRLPRLGRGKKAADDQSEVAYTTQYNPDKRSKCKPNFNQVATAKRNPRKQILYKTFKRLEDKDYDLEIALLENKMILAATNVEEPETITIRIPEDKSKYWVQEIARQLLEVFKGNYELLTKKMEIVGNKLMILTPTQEELDLIGEQKADQRSHEVYNTTVYSNPEIQAPLQKSAL
eukprot:TRINITY_DN5947_c0_g2_i2.p1 TRINITY_DN5947_c0_g2~~TRINITY_DN5947_c0_g2_i2.p1  ORF type:complete len:341 (+),score=81.13 TRINITY_DN5947_c0_g2_i2:157-1179(+)